MSRQNNRATAALVVILTIATSLGLMASLTPTPSLATQSHAQTDQVQMHAELGGRQTEMVKLGRPGHQID